MEGMKKILTCIANKILSGKDEDGCPGFKYYIIIKPRL
jgi:hypothetical protein